MTSHVKMPGVMMLKKDSRILAVSRDGDAMEVDVLFSPVFIPATDRDNSHLRADKVRLPDGETAWVYMDGVHFYDPESRQEFALLLA